MLHDESDDIKRVDERYNQRVVIIQAPGIAIYAFLLRLILLQIALALVPKHPAKMKYLPQMENVAYIAIQGATE